MRKWTREEALRAARGYTAQILSASAAPGSRLEAGFCWPSSVRICCLSRGHQPALFHPGVWVKNFAIHEMAIAVRGHFAQSVGRYRRDGFDANSRPDRTDVQASGSSGSPSTPIGPAARGKKTRFSIASCSRASIAASAICLHPGGSHALLREFWPAAVRRVASSFRGSATA